MEDGFEHVDLDGAGGSYWSLGSRQAIPATLRAWMLMGSASLTSLWRHQLSPIVTPIFQITYQGGQALVSIITSLLTLLAACLRDAALAVVHALRQTLAGVGGVLWQWIGHPLAHACSVVWVRALDPMILSVGQLMSGLVASLWAALHSVLTAIGAVLWTWLLVPSGQVLGGAITALGLGLQAVGLWLWSCLASAAALLLDLLWRYMVGPLVRLLASFVGAAAVATGGLIGTAALANVAADWLGLGSFVDLLTGRPRQRPMTRF